MRSCIAVLTVFILLVIAPLPLTRALESTDSGAPRQIKWPTNIIPVAFSTSLSSPGPNVKPGSDVVGAARRALSRWSTMANLRFVETRSRAKSISAHSGGDGISLITIADTPENNSTFAGGQGAGRTRVFYDEASGAILEADIVLNPHPLSTEGAPLQFSTDGTPGTYDLESTLTHELGHLLGLGHSLVLASTMQSRQAINGIYRLPALTERTLSEDDRSRVRALYGPHGGSGAIAGKLLSGFPGTKAIDLAGLHVWAESLSTGRLIASDLTAADGSFFLGAIPPGQYRVLAQPPAPGESDSIAPPPQFPSVELGDKVNVSTDITSALDFVLPPVAGRASFLQTRLLGTNGELSTSPIVAAAGERLTVYLAGEGLAELPAAGISVTSPFMSVDPVSVTLQQFGTTFPVISFEVMVAANAPFGDYSIKLQLNSGEVTYVAGGITIDPGVDSAAANPVDDARFFVAQHARDFLGREIDPYKSDDEVASILHCRSDLECVRQRRHDASVGFLLGSEVWETGSFIYRLYKSAFGRRPTFAEFRNDSHKLGGDGAALALRKRELVRAFVVRREFLQKYPRDLQAEQFIRRLLDSVNAGSTADLLREPATFAALNDGSSEGRALIVQRVIDDPAFARAERAPAFVLMQYFGYLQRDPDENGYNLWLNELNNRLALDPTTVTPYRGLVCGFITSVEYQSRFGMLITRTDRECKP